MSYIELETELLILKHDLHQLRLSYRDVESKNKTQQEIIKKLETENKDLKKELIKLQDKLNINSSNSGLPSSRDIYRIEKRTKRKSVGKVGGQPGHEYKGYEYKTADEIIDLYPEEKVCDCGGSLSEEAGYRSHQKIEIPPIKPYVTEYRLHSSICSICHKNYRSKLKTYKLLERNAESIITSLGGFFNNSKRDIQSILSQIFNLDISLGLISNSEARVSAKLQDKYNELLETAENSNYLHLDESSANNKGKLGWCWVAASQAVTVYKLGKSRARYALEEFLPEYEGNVITDRYAVYNVYDQSKRQICLAHLRRDFKRFAHSRYASLGIFGQSLLEIIDLVFTIHKYYKAGKIDKAYYLRRMRKIQKKILYYLKRVSQLEECEQARRVANNILKSFNMMWLFVSNSEIEPTNNFAERQIKHHVKYRKNSLFTWSSRGQRFIERTKSIFATAKLQGIKPFSQLYSLI